MPSKSINNWSFEAYFCRDHANEYRRADALAATSGIFKPMARLAAPSNRVMCIVLSLTRCMHNSWHRAQAGFVVAGDQLLPQTLCCSAFKRSDMPWRGETRKCCIMLRQLTVSMLSASDTEQQRGASLRRSIVMAVIFMRNNLVCAPPALGRYSDCAISLVVKIVNAIPLSKS